MENSEANFEIIVGSYEQFLLGYQLSKENEKYQLVQTIADHAHSASLRSVCSSKRLVVSGGSDEVIRLYDFNQRKECGNLVQHSGTVTSLSFTPDGTHLISSSEDGSIAIFRIGNWMLEKLWPKAHKGQAVNCVKIHPSGKMAMSLGNDGTLRTWNLIKGRPAYTVNFSQKTKRPDILEWSPTGTRFAFAYNNKIDIFNTENASISSTIECEGKVTSIKFVKDNRILIGSSTGQLILFRSEDDNFEKLWNIYIEKDKRIKALELFKKNLIVASSPGILSVYKLKKYNEPVLLTKIDTKCRITCLTIFCQYNSNEEDSKMNCSEIIMNDYIWKKEEKDTNCEINKKENKIVEPAKKKQKISSLKTQKWIVENTEENII